MLAKRRRKLLLALAFLAAGTFLAVWLWPSSEPSYQGKTLSQWLKEICGTRPGKQPNFMAVDAIRTIGTNGIPHLFKMLSYKPSRLRVRIDTTANWLLRDYLGWRKEYFSDPAYLRWDRAMCGFIALGPSASNAIPRLIAFLDDPYVGGKAVYCLTSIGATAVPALAEVLTNGTLRARQQVARHMSELGTNARTALPALVMCMRDSDSDVRHGATVALARLQLEPRIAVPALTDALNDSDDNVRYDALQGLGMFGPHATGAAPAVVRLLGDPVPSVRTEATNTLQILTAPGPVAH